MTSANNIPLHFSPRLLKKVDPQALGKIAVLMGGKFAEREVSLVSGANVMAALDRQGCQVKAIDVGNDVYEQLNAGQFDRVFIALHGRGGEDGTIQSLLEIMSLPYTGSGVLASALALDKVRSKSLWRDAGLPVAPGQVVDAHTDWEALARHLGLPIFVKPIAEGSSVGVSRVDAVEALPEAYEKAAALGGAVLAEKFLDGEEYTVGILSDAALPIIHIRSSASHTFYDYHAKYVDDYTEYLIPCGLSAEKENALQKAALEAYRILGCRHWARVDAMTDRQGNFYLLELNTIPGLTEHSLVPKAAKHLGVSFDELILQILAHTLVE